MKEVALTKEDLAIYTAQVSRPGPAGEIAWSVADDSWIATTRVASQLPAISALHAMDGKPLTVVQMVTNRINARADSTDRFAII